MASRLIIVADDYGYSALYNEGIITAARAGAIDATSAMVTRDDCDPKPISETGVEVGLHLERPEDGGDPGAAVGRQADRFEDIFGRPPDHIDGHHHCHADPALSVAVADLARRLGIRVRSVRRLHREQLRSLGIETPDRLIGRNHAAEPALPEEIDRILAGQGPAPDGLTEWMVHPGRADPSTGSGYDAAREEDLELLLRLAGEATLRRLRSAS